jgi:two-component system, LytTR family, sensor histidine kinase AlgZ
VRKNSRLPNLRNLGIYLRILLIVNLSVAIAAAIISNQLNEFFPLLIELSAVVQPILLLSILGLYMVYPILDKLNYWVGLAAIVLLEVAVTGFVVTVFNYYFSFVSTTNTAHACLLTVIVTGIVLYYFYLQQRAYSPAIAEARLQALQARIRPHFLFNSINAVLSVIRSQPKLAETALEDMADLFRVLMADNRDLVPIIEEIALCRQYLALEKLRLEERLKITWQIDKTPPDAMIPPLILQPLLENAVYHGIEPMPEGGEIMVHIYAKGKELHIVISNPYAPHNDHHNGNKMALANIKERLQLHFDLEAALKAEAKDNRYEVHIRLPLEAG